MGSFVTAILALLTVVMEDAPVTLFPPLAISAYSFRVVELVYSFIFRIDGDLKLQPELARSYTISSSSDGMEITVELKRGVRTCSGEEIDAKMVANSIKKYMDYGRLRFIRSVEVIGEHRVRLKAEKNYSVLYELVIPVFPERWTDCTGDFEVLDFSPGYYVILRSRRSGKLVMVKGVRNDITRILELEKGDAHILVNAVPPHLLSYVRGLKDVDVITQKSVNINYIALNTRNPYLSRKEVRQAIFHAIDREKVISEVISGLGEPINSMIPNMSPFYCDCGRYSYDVTKAIELLERAGFRRSDGYFFKLLWKTSTVRYAVRSVKAIASYLENVGIKVEIVLQEFHKFFSDIVAGNYDIFSLNLVGVRSPDIFRFLAHSESFPPRGANRTFFSNPYLDELIEMAEKEDNRERAKTLYRKVQEILMDEVPYIPVYQLKDVIAYRTDRVDQRRMRNLNFVPGGSLSFLIDLLE